MIWHLPDRTTITKEELDERLFDILQIYELPERYGEESILKVVIIRHAEVDFTRSSRCTSKEFDTERCEYDRAPIKDADYEVPCFKYHRIYISTLPRSRNTANRLFGEAAFKETGLIDEVSLKSSFDTERKMPLWFWNMSGTLQWMFNISRQSEGRSRTRMRARKFVKILCRDGSDCVVVTHGFYMLTLLQEMKKAGFRTSKSRLVFKNGEYVVAER